MKIAGRKSEGAWFRTNKDIQALTVTERANLAGSINNSAYIDLAYEDIIALIDEAGVTGLDVASSSEAWSQQMTLSGIPHQIWFGRLSWTSYAKGEDGIYRAKWQHNIGLFAKDLRKICLRYFMTRRQALDLLTSKNVDQGNVGGNPDAKKITDSQKS